MTKSYETLEHTAFDYYDTIACVFNSELTGREIHSIK